MANGIISYELVKCLRKSNENYLNAFKTFELNTVMTNGGLGDQYYDFLRGLISELVDTMPKNWLKDFIINILWKS